ncbi:ABC transporter permease [Pseudolysinimonas kribbensis]|uniref:ABC transporter permease n=1 Tax=Pseudolysinimonas kribbensis TaxID=433641 RepID=UPI0033822702
MSVQAADVLGEAVATPPRIRGGRARRNWVLGIYAVVVLALLLVPIAYTIVFSFNQPGRTNATWRGFSFDNWTGILDDDRVVAAFVTSIVVGVVATLVAAAIGTAIAIALVRYRFRFRTGLTLLLFLPMATPEVVLGSGLGSQLLNLGIDKGVGTIIVAHIMFCISFVVITVRARVASLDPAIEEAGRDLYASPAQVWWRITFPLLLPGIVAACLLSFALSFDDFIITAFVSGNAETFPKYIYTAAARAIPAQANVFASIIFLLAIVLVLGQQLAAGARRRKLAREG